MILEVKNLTHTYMPDTVFSQTAIKDISFTVKKGEFIGLIGHSGSGKSTLIQHLNGLLTPTSGQVLIHGENIFQNKALLKQVRFRVGLVFQYPEAQLFEETVYDDIAFGPKNMGLSSEEIKRRIYHAAELTGIQEELLQKSPFDLSGGQKRRAAIAGVLAMEPEILILDEPTAGLDPKGRNKILSRIRELHKKTDMTVILVSHSMEEIAKHTDRILVMNRGEIFMEGDQETIFSKGEKLEEIGLSIPQITKVFIRLEQLGYPVSRCIYTIEEGKKEMKRLLKKREELH